MQLCHSNRAMQKINSLYSDFPTMTKIQIYIIIVHSRHTSVCICWTPSHVNIAGNESTEQLAKQAAQSQDDVIYTHYPHKENYPIMKNSLRRKWQQSWRNMDNNKLRSIKLNIKSWPSSRSKIRQIEVGLTKLRIGQARFTHGHLMKQMSTIL